MGVLPLAVERRFPSAPRLRGILPTVRLVMLVLVVIVGLVVIDVAAARIPPLYRNCAALNKRYPHGVGRLKARDHSTGTPVTTFKRSDRLYRLALSYNRGLDRDKDGIACEKA